MPHSTASLSPLSSSSSNYLDLPFHFGWPNLTFNTSGGGTTSTNSAGDDIDGDQNPNIADYTSLIRAPGYNDEGLFFSLTLGGALLLLFLCLVTYLTSTRVLWIRRLYRPNHTIPPPPLPLGSSSGEEEEAAGLVVQKRVHPKKKSKSSQKKKNKKKQPPQQQGEIRSPKRPRKGEKQEDEKGEGGVNIGSDDAGGEEKGVNMGEVRTSIRNCSASWNRLIVPIHPTEEAVNVVILSGEGALHRMEKPDEIDAYLIPSGGSFASPGSPLPPVNTEETEKKKEDKPVIAEGATEVEAEEEEEEEDTEEEVKDPGPAPKTILRRKRVGRRLPYCSAFFRLPTWEDWWSIEEEQALSYLQPLLPSRHFYDTHPTLRPTSTSTAPSSSFSSPPPPPRLEEEDEDRGASRREKQSNSSLTHYREDGWRRFGGDAMPSARLSCTTSPSMFASSSPSPPPRSAAISADGEEEREKMKGGRATKKVVIDGVEEENEPQKKKKRSDLSQSLQNAWSASTASLSSILPPPTILRRSSRTSGRVSSTAPSPASTAFSSSFPRQYVDPQVSLFLFTLKYFASLLIAGILLCTMWICLFSSLGDQVAINTITQNAGFCHRFDENPDRCQQMAPKCVYYRKNETSSSSNTTIPPNNSSSSLSGWVDVVQRSLASLLHEEGGRRRRGRGHEGGTHHHHHHHHKTAAPVPLVEPERKKAFGVGMVHKGPPLGIMEEEGEEGGANDQDEGCISVEIHGLSQLSVLNIAPGSTLWWGVSLCNLGFAVVFIIATVYFVQKVNPFVAGVMRLQMKHAVGYRVACVRGLHNGDKFSAEAFREQYLVERAYFPRKASKEGGTGATENPPPPPSSSSFGSPSSVDPSRAGASSSGAAGMTGFSPSSFSTEISLLSMPPEDKRTRPSPDETPSMAVPKRNIKKEDREDEDGVLEKVEVVVVVQEAEGEEAPPPPDPFSPKAPLAVSQEETTTVDDEDKEEDLVLRHAPPLCRGDTCGAIFQRDSYRTSRKDATFTRPGVVQQISLVRTSPPGMDQAIRAAEVAKIRFQEAVAHQMALQRRYFTTHPPPTPPLSPPPSSSSLPRQPKEERSKNGTDEEEEGNDDDGVEPLVEREGITEVEDMLQAKIPVLKCFAPLTAGFHRIPAVPYYEARYRKRANMLNALLREIPEQRSAGSVFILFSDARSAFEFVHLFNCCKASVVQGSYAVIAGPASGLLHGNLLMSRWSYYFRVLLFSLLFLVLVFCWSIPVGLLSSLNNLAAIPGLGPAFYEAYVTHVSLAVQNILTAYLPVMVLALFGIVLPSIITWMVSSMGLYSQREINAGRLYLEYLFMVLTSVIFQMALQGGLRQLSTMVLGGVDTNTVSHFFASCITPEGGYWYAKVIMAFALSTWLDVVDVSRLFPLLWTRGSAHVQRHYDALFEPCRFFDYPDLYSGELTMLAVGLLFHMTVPLLSLFVAIYFLLRYYTMRQRLYERYRPSQYHPLDDCTDFGVSAQVLRCAVSLFALSEFCAIWLLRIRKHQGGFILCCITFAVGVVLWIWVFFRSQQWVASLQNARNLFPQPVAIMGSRTNPVAFGVPPPSKAVPLPAVCETSLTRAAGAPPSPTLPMAAGEERDGKGKISSENVMDAVQPSHTLPLLSPPHQQQAEEEEEEVAVLPCPLSPLSPSSSVHPFGGALLPTQNSLLAAFHPKHQQLAPIDVDADVLAIKQFEHTVVRYWTYSISWFEGDLVEDEETTESAQYSHL